VYRRLCTDIRGGTLIEYAVLLPLFVMITVGIMQAGQVLWTQAALQHAVDMAARCASVNTATCGTPLQVRAYALTQAYGVSLPANTFTASAQPCGNQVVAAYAFTFETMVFPAASLSLSARACYPL
jgi:Flp pilus assembly protein TadG